MEVTFASDHQPLVLNEMFFDDTGSIFMTLDQHDLQKLGLSYE